MHNIFSKGSYGQAKSRKGPDKKGLQKRKTLLKVFEKYS